MVPKAPLVRGKQDNDEACSIETSSSDEDANAVSDEEEQEEVMHTVARKQRNTSDQLMEDSVRTANFKGSQNPGPQLLQANQSNVISTNNT